VESEYRHRGPYIVWSIDQLLTAYQVPAVSTSVGSNRAINKLEWDRKDGRRAALGSSDGKLYIYDIGDMGIPRESEWTDLQRTIGNMAGAAGYGSMEDSSSRSMAGR
jgi:dynein intermediate chain, cytosolic